MIDEGETEGRKTSRATTSGFQVRRRHLPHWEEAGSVYFATWTTLNRRGLAAEERTAVLEAVLHWDNVRWEVFAAVVMSDHVHVLGRPMSTSGLLTSTCHSLESIVHSVKSFSSHAINRIRGASGSVWQTERENRIIRDEDEFWQKWQYIRDNPVKAGLAESAEEYPWFFQQCVEDLGKDRRDAGPNGSSCTRS
jgi:REP element-mobilizing transposase RayT